MLTQHSMLLDVFVSVRGAFLSQSMACDQADQLASEETWDIIVIVPTCPCASATKFVPFIERSVIDFTVGKNSNALRSAFKEFDVTFVTVKSTGSKWEKCNVSSAENGSVVSILTEGLEGFVCRFEGIVKFLVMDDVDGDVRVLVQDFVELGHDRCPIVLAVLSSIEKLHFVGADRSLGIRGQVGNLVFDDQYVRVIAFHGISQSFGADLDGMDGPQLDVIALLVPLEAIRVIVKLSDQQHSLCGPLLTLDIQTAEPLLDQDVGVEGVIPFLPMRALNAWDGVQHGKRLPDARPGAALFGGNGVDVDLVYGDLHGWRVPFHELGRRTDSRLDCPYHVLKGLHLLALGQADFLEPIRVATVIDIAASHFKHVQAGLLEQIFDAVHGEKPQVSSIQQPLVGISPLPAEQVPDNCPVLDVGDAGEDLGVFLGCAGQSLEHVPRVVKVFEDVTEDDAIGFLDLERIDIAFFYVLGEDFVAMFCRGDSGISIEFIGKPANGRIHPPISFAERSGSTANFKHDLRIRWDQTKQVNVHSVEIIGDLCHGLPPGKKKTQRNYYINGRAA